MGRWCLGVHGPHRYRLLPRRLSRFSVSSSTSPLGFEPAPEMMTSSPS